MKGISTRFGGVVCDTNRGMVAAFNIKVMNVYKLFIVELVVIREGILFVKTNGLQIEQF